MRSMRRASGVIAMALWIGSQAVSGIAYADSKGAQPAPGKPNGDSSTDLAPLDQSGHASEDGPLAHANTPPIGGATQGGGSNPKEMGPVDAAKDSQSDKKK